MGSMRCNLSWKSHAELDEATELDRGNPVHFGMLNAMLKKCIPSLTIFGGCCGSNTEHIQQIIKALKKELQ
jgi:S-methylmethionine-dependent homocysteine/selenocysteine methylase